MNSPGAIRPRSGCCQRTSADAKVVEPGDQEGQAFQGVELRLLTPFIDRRVPERV